MVNTAHASAPLENPQITLGDILLYSRLRNAIGHERAQNKDDLFTVIEKSRFVELSPQQAPIAEQIYDRIGQALKDVSDNEERHDAITDPKDDRVLTELGLILQEALLIRDTIALIGKECVALCDNRFVFFLITRDGRHKATSGKGWGIPFGRTTLQAVLRTVEEGSRLNWNSLHAHVEAGEVLEDGRRYYEQVAGKGAPLRQTGFQELLSLAKSIEMLEFTLPTQQEIQNMGLTPAMQDAGKKLLQTRFGWTAPQIREFCLSIVAKPTGIEKPKI